MDDTPNQCCICGREISRGTGRIPRYFCPTHYEEWRPLLDAPPSWLRFLINSEKQRRKRRNKFLGGDVRTVRLPARMGL